ncbi:MAG: alpha/beta fold hydrolase, partial [Mycobacterium sp.]
MEVRKGTARSGDLDLYYEDMGDAGDPPVLLIMGLGTQLLLWRTAFCEKLVAAGLRVIRYDNRDVGLSSKTERRHSAGALIPRMVRFWLGLPGRSLYTLEDMADDAAAVLDHLGIGRAHIVGASMGGMIAQVFAARFGERTRSLGVIFSSNNRPFLPPPGPRALFAILKGPPPGSPRDVIVDNAVRVTRIIGSPAYPAPEQRIRAEAIESYERCYYPWAIPKHFSAILATGSLTRYDRQVTAPTVVLHG